MQSVQRAELWGVILALQASRGAHLGVDNLNVVRHVGLLDGVPGARPFEIVEDGDLLCLIDRMLQLRGFDTVKVSKVAGHADEGMVLYGRVRDLDRLGKSAADEAAEFGGRVGVCNRWYPVVRHLHRFFVAIAMATAVQLNTLFVGCCDVRDRPGDYGVGLCCFFSGTPGEHQCRRHWLCWCGSLFVRA